MNKTTVNTISIDDKHGKLFLQTLVYAICNESSIQHQMNDKVAKSIKNTPIPVHYEHLRPKNNVVLKQNHSLYQKNQIGRSFKKF